MIKKTMLISGKVHASDIAGVTTALNALDAAYADGKDVVLFHDDGITRTHHQLISSQSISGVRIVSGPNFDPGDGGEYTTYRTFSVVVDADFAGDDNLLEFEETLSTTGTSGKKRVWIPVLVGPARQQIVRQKTIATATQTGSALGLLNYPVAPPPIFPGEEDVEARNLIRASPSRNGIRFVDFGITWSYQFTSNRALLALPHVR